MSTSEKVWKYLLGKLKHTAKKFGKASTNQGVSEERKKDLLEKFKYAAREFGKVGTKSDHQAVPKEQQLSIDLGNKKVFGIVNKTLHRLENTFKYLFPHYDYSSEIGTKEKRTARSNFRVKCFTPEEQAEHTKIAYKGELYVDLKPKMEDNELSFNGELYDTTGEISKGEKGCVAYIITLDGKLITHKHINVNKHTPAHRHSTLAGGKPILCSGLIKVVNGKITYIDNNSGHYKPTSANLYNAVEKLKGLFSENAKIVHRSLWANFIKQIPFVYKIVPTKQEPIKKFMERMEKKGRDGLTKYERHFKRVKEFNEQYEQKLFLANYKPAHVSDCSDVRTVKIGIEHSLRKIIGANYGHKPKIDIEYNEKEAVGIDIVFRYKNDCDKFIKLLDLKKHSYHCTPDLQDKKEIDMLPKYARDEKDRTAKKQLIPNKLRVFMATDQANEFIKNTLQTKIDSVEQLGNTATVKKSPNNCPKPLFPIQVQH